MTTRMSNVLVVGETSGIAERFARHLHSQGKNFVVTGRCADRMNAFSKELSGLETR